MRRVPPGAGATLGLWVAFAAAAGAPRLSAQARAAELVAAAREELRAGHVDSGLALLRVALDSATPATPAERVTALVWRGILEFFRGGDSLARQSFREALARDPTLRVGGLAQLDSGLAAAFEAERRAVPRVPAETAYSCVAECQGLDQAPDVVPGSPTTHLVPPDSLPPGALPLRPGMAAFRFVVDTLGAVEPRSVQVVTSPNPSLNDAFVAQIRRARFSPGRRGGRPVRVVLEWRIGFGTP